MLTVDKFGRRPLLLIGVGGMFVSAALIGIACQVAYSSAAATYITIIMLFVFVGSYQVNLPFNLPPTGARTCLRMLRGQGQKDG